MWPASAHYFETIKRSHTRLSYVELLKDGAVVATQQAGLVIDPGTGDPVSSIGGAITVDKTTIRRAGTMQLLDVSGLLLPNDVADLFAPFVTEIRTWIGARYWDAPLPAVNAVPFNLLAADDSSFEGSLGTWGLVTNVLTLTRVNAQAFDGSWSLEIKSLASGNMTARNNTANRPPVTVGNIYTMSAWFRAAVSPRSVQAAIHWVDSGGTNFASSFGNSVIDSTTGWTQAFVTAAAPANAVSAWVGLVVVATGAANEVHYADLFNLYAGSPSTVMPTVAADTEYVPVSTLVITNVANDYPQLTLTGSDRMWSLANFPSVYVVAAGTNVKDALVTLLGAFMPGSRLALNIPDTEHTTPAQAFDANTSVADAAHTLAQVAGWQLYCDPMGTFTATDEPSTDDDPVLVLEPGQFSVMGRPGRTVGAEGELYTAVVFTGEGGTTPPVRSYIEDTDPNSLTYAARVGVRPYFESSPLITTQTQCDTAARTTMRRILGLSDTIVVPIMSNYALESGDVIHATDPQQGIDANLIVDAFPIPIRAADGLQMLSCRSRVIR
jgi:hypothetical protein